MKTINASEFKAKCLAILDEVNRTREVITILKRGKAVAQLIPPVYAEKSYPQHNLRGSVIIRGDVVGPVLPSESWEAEGISS